MYMNDAIQGMNDTANALSMGKDRWHIGGSGRRLEADGLVADIGEDFGDLLSMYALRVNHAKIKTQETLERYREQYVSLVRIMREMQSSL